MVHVNENSIPSAPTPAAQLEADAQLKESRRSVLSRCNLLDDCDRDAHCEIPRNNEGCKEDGNPKKDISIGAGVPRDGTARRVAAIFEDVLPKTDVPEGTRDLKDATSRPSKGRVPASINRRLLRSGEATPDDAALPAGVGITKLIRTNPNLERSSRSLPGAFSCDGIASSYVMEETSESEYVGGDIDIESPSPRPEAAEGNGNGTLAVATKVAEEDPVLPEAREVDPEQAAEKRRKEIKQNLVKATTVLLLFLILVTVVVLLVKRDSNGSETLPDHELTLPETSPDRQTLSPEEHLLSLLPEFTQDAIHKENNSPQKEAYEWILQDSNLADLPDNRLVQRFALATLFYSTNRHSSGWFKQDNWVSHDVHECEWYDFDTHGFYEYPEHEEGRLYNATNTTEHCSKDGDYEHLWLLHNGLEGTLPEELYLLTSLKSISLDRNKLQGSLSTRIGGLTKLEALAIYRNEMTGSLPTQLGLLTNLEFLWLMANEWTGSIPTELGLLSDSLVYFLADSCQLTGHFPSELGQLSNLQWLWLYNNQLTGALPTEMGLLKTVNSFAIDFNKFEGPIPTEVGGMTSVETFHIENSFISGTIPTELALCTVLDAFVISSTLISGTIPTELGLMHMGRRLWAWHTLLKGSLPTELGLLTHNAQMDFSNNHLTGTVPSEIGNMDSVGLVFLNGNQFTGTLPTEFGQLQNLWTLHLNENQLTGPIPSQLGALDSMVDFWDESSNRTVEYWNITDIQLENNKFSGPLPSSLGLLKDLATLSIYNNSDLTGVVPPGFCNGRTGEEKGLVFSVDCALVECNCTVCTCV